MRYTFSSYTKIQHIDAKWQNNFTKDIETYEIDGLTELMIFPYYSMKLKPNHKGSYRKAENISQKEQKIYNRHI